MVAVKSKQQLPGHFLVVTVIDPDSGLRIEVGTVRRRTPFDASTVEVHHE